MCSSGDDGPTLFVCIRHHWEKYLMYMLTANEFLFSWFSKLNLKKYLCVFWQLSKKFLQIQHGYLNGCISSSCWHVSAHRKANIFFLKLKGLIPITFLQKLVHLSGGIPMICAHVIRAQGYSNFYCNKAISK